MNHKKFQEKASGGMDLTSAVLRQRHLTCDGPVLVCPLVLSYIEPLGIHDIRREEKRGSRAGQARSLCSWWQLRMSRFSLVTLYVAFGRKSLCGCRTDYTSTNLIDSRLYRPMMAVDRDSSESLSVLLKTKNEGSDEALRTRVIFPNTAWRPATSS